MTLDIEVNPDNPLESLSTSDRLNSTSGESPSSSKITVLPQASISLPSIVIVITEEREEVASHLSRNHHLHSSHRCQPYRQRR